MVFDVEATCTESSSWDYPNEIIEFPVILIESKRLEIVSIKTLSHHLFYFNLNGFRVLRIQKSSRLNETPLYYNHFLIISFSLKISFF